MGTFQSFWHGSNLSPYHQLALKSFIDHGHRFLLFAYEKVKVPAGVELCDASEILPRERIFLHKTAVGSGTVNGFSDVFRFHLLHKRGGWWVDTDVVCLSDTIEEPEIGIGWQDHRLVGTAIMRVQAGTELTAALCEAADRIGTDVRYGDIGPGLMTRIAKESGLTQLLLPQAALYPVAPHEALDLLRPSKAGELKAKVAGSAMLHLWNEMFGRAGILRWVAPPNGCFIRELFRRHGFPVNDRLCYTADEIERLNRNLLLSMDASTQHKRAKALEAETADLRQRLAKAEAEIASLKAKRNTSIH